MQRHRSSYLVTSREWTGIKGESMSFIGLFKVSEKWRKLRKVCLRLDEVHGGINVLAICFNLDGQQRGRGPRRNVTDGLHHLKLIDAFLCGRFDQQIGTIRRGQIEFPVDLAKSLIICISELDSILCNLPPCDVQRTR